MTADKSRMTGLDELNKIDTRHYFSRQVSWNLIPASAIRYAIYIKPMESVYTTRSLY